MIDEVDCIGKVNDDRVVDSDAFLNVDDEVVDVKVNLDVGCVWNDVRRIRDV